MKALNIVSLLSSAQNFRGFLSQVKIQNLYLQGPVYNTLLPKPYPHITYFVSSAPATSSSLNLLGLLFIFAY